MQSRHGRYRAPAWLALVVVVAASSACCQPVKEDRTVTWSSQGDNVGFQHGDDGVFVADREGGGLERVYQPGPDIVATSTPLWSPTDGRLIFTTARNPNQPAGPIMPRITQGDPSGDTFLQMPVVYTCWLRAESTTDQPAEPRPLFEGALDHVGYVAANLAVRWHPQGDQIVFIDQVDSQHHGLFTYDLASGNKCKILGQTAQAMVFDWCPDNAHLACVLASGANIGANDGIWIGSPGEAVWWHVPESESLAPAKLDSLLERLKASRPAWSRDGARFAFVTAGSRIWLGDISTHEVRRLTESDVCVDDLAWSPDGKRLGLVRGDDPPSLGMLSLTGDWLPSVEGRAVRRFVGWDASGRSLAYVAADDVPLADEASWALLLTADPQARDAVFVAPGAGGAAPQEVVSGLRVTFPHWSPREEKLSLWFTFTPSHRSWLSRWLGWGLLPGDPAALVDLATGHVDWMAVSPWEEAQVGHYHLLKHDYAEAWRRYERGRQGEAELSQATTAIDYFNRLQSPRDVSVFEYVCLRKLGRERDADERLAAFRERFPPDPSHISPGTTGMESMDFRLRELFARGGLAASLVQDLFIAEVCLSVDAPEEAEIVFRPRMKDDESDMARLSAAIVMAQLLLLEKRNDEYLDLSIDVVVPAALKNWRATATSPEWPSFDSQGVLMLAGGLTLLPLASDEFVAEVDEARVARLTESLEVLLADAADDLTRYAVDAALLAAYQRLDNAEQVSSVLARIDANSVAAGWSSARDLSRRIAEFRTEIRRLSQTDFGRSR